VDDRKRSYFAMLLSLILPGLGQLYLRKPLKSLVLFLGVVFAGMIIYLNSFPVSSWQDLTCFDDGKEWWKERRSDTTNPEPLMTELEAVHEQEEDSGHHLWIWTFESGKKLMYRPSWKLKMSGFVQGSIFWLFAVYDGWRGQKGFNKRAFKRKLMAVQEHKEAEEVKKKAGAA